MEINPNAEVSWDVARDTNKANWDDRVAIHVESYGLDAFRDDPTYISAVVREDLPALTKHLGRENLEGLTLCHLQCHIGTDTVSLARLGAHVTGVDFSEPALEAAAGLAAELTIEADWVRSDVMEAAAAVGKTFDVVYTSIGATCWLEDLNRWATQVAALLESGGLFYYRDGHPFLYVLDEDTYPPVARFRYFPNGKAQEWDEELTYVGDKKLTATRTFEYPHSVSEIMMALLNAGLVIEGVYENDALPWNYNDAMEPLPDGHYIWPKEMRDVIPCTLTVVARKP